MKIPATKFSEYIQAAQQKLSSEQKLMSRMKQAKSTREHVQDGEKYGSDTHITQPAGALDKSQDTRTVDKVTRSVPRAVTDSPQPHGGIGIDD
jgi:hypothetical protein